MNRLDPILNELLMLAQRALLFIALALVHALGLWMWFWMHFEAKTFLSTLEHLGKTLPMPLDSFASVQMIGMLWIGSADTAVLFLLLGRWWQRRADVLLRRGTRYVDDRDVGRR